MRVTRSAMIESLTQDYIETARAMWPPTRSIMPKHAFRNALIPVITVLGLQFGFLIVGTVLDEFTFSLVGFGALIVEAVRVRDYPVVQGARTFTAGVFIVVNLLVNVL